MNAIERLLVSVALPKIVRVRQFLGDAEVTNTPAAVSVTRGHIRHMRPSLWCGV